MNAKDYYERGESKSPEEAIKDYSKAITVDPNFVPAYRARGGAYLALDQKLLALADLNKAIELDPCDEDLWNNRAWIKECIREKSGQGDYTYSYFLRGVKLYNKGDYNSAFDHFSTVITTSPVNALAWYYRGLCSEQEENFNLALDDYTKAIAVDPNFGEAYNRRGKVNSELGNCEKSKNDYATATGIERMFF